MKKTVNRNACSQFCSLAILALGVSSVPAQRPKQNAVGDPSPFAGYPNPSRGISGHRHRNMVAPRPSIDPAHTGKEYGFREVETASLRDFPQQFRMFGTFHNSGTTISIITTEVDQVAQDGSLAALSRSDAIAVLQIFTPTFQRIVVEVWI